LSPIGTRSRLLSQEAKMRQSKKHSAMSNCTTSTIGLFVLLAVFSFGTAVAQGTNARLSGTVLDPSGAVIRGSSIKLENIETGIVLTATSNDAGLYEFPSVQPGRYRLEAQAPKFKPLISEPLIFQVAGQ